MSYPFEREKEDTFPVSKIPFEISVFQTVLDGLIKGKLVPLERYFDIGKYKEDDFIDLLIKQDNTFLLGLLQEEQQEVLVAHLFLQGKGEKALNLIQKRGVKSISREILNNKIFPYFRRNISTSKDTLGKLIKFLSTHPKFFSESYDGIFPMVREIVIFLIENKEYDFCKEIIPHYFPIGEKEIAFLTVEILEGKRKITEHDVNLFTHPRIQDILSPLISYLKLLDSIGVDALILRDIIETVELTGEWSKYGKLGDIYEIKAKIRNRLYELGAFNDAEVFLEVTKDTAYYKGNFLQRKFNYYLQQRNRKESHKVLNDILQYYGFLEGNIEKKIEEVSHEVKWSKRLEEYETLAEVLLNKVLFEVTFGDENTVKQDMMLLTDLVHRISVPCDADLIKKIEKYHKGDKEHGINRYEKRCLGHLKRRRRRIKRDIKTRILALGFEHILPKTEGWRDKIKNTLTSEEIYKSKQSRREEKSVRRDSEIKESNKKYYEQQEKKVFKIVESLLSKEYEKEEDLVRSFFKEGDFNFRWDLNLIWRTANALVEKRPQVYSFLLHSLLKQTFTHAQIGHDHDGNTQVNEKDYEYILKFLIFGFENNIITLSNIYSISEAGRRYLQNRGDGYTEGQFYELLLFPIIRRLSETGKLKEAWQLFYYIYEKKNDHSEEQISGKILGFFQGFLKDFPGFQFLDSTEFNPKLDIKEQILFYNSKLEAALASKNEEEYELNKQKLQQLFSSDAEILLFINLLNAGTTRSHHQKRDELMFVYKLSSISQRVRRRVVWAMIEQKLPDLESVHEIIGEKIPYKLGKIYFEKLASVGSISSDISTLISESSIIHIREIFAKHRSKFNTAIEILKKHKVGDWFTQKRNKVEKRDWEGIQTLLKYIEYLNYEVFIKMREIGYDEEKIQEYNNILTHLMSRGLKNYLGIFQENRRERDSFNSEIDIYELEIAHYESKILEKFILSVNEKAKVLNRRLLIVPNLSYGYLPVSLIYRTLLKDGNIDILFGIKVGSSESHNNEQVFIPDLFGKEVEGILNNQPIILVVDGTQHIVPRDGAGQGSRYPDAYQGYLNQVIVMNQAYGIDGGSSIERYGKSQDSIESLLSSRKIREVVNRFREVIREKIEIPYEFGFWNTNEDVLAIRSNREEVANLGSIDVGSIKGPTVIFCNVGVEHDKLPTHLKHERYKHTPAYFDDSGKIMQFDVIHNDGGWQTVNPLERAFTEKVLKSEAESIPMGLHPQIKIKSA